MRGMFARIVAIGLVAGLGVAGAAQAQSVGRWDGAYGGLGLGYGNFDSDSALTGNADGFIGGAFLGYQRDYGDWVLGGEVAYDTGDADFDGGGKVDEFWRLKLRVGRDYGRTLIYGVGGIAQAEARVGGIDRDETGWFIGAGAERAMTDRLSVGTEVLYDSIDDLGGPGNDVDGVTIQVRATLRF